MPDFDSSLMEGIGQREQSKPIHKAGAKEKSGGFVLLVISKPSVWGPGSGKKDYSGGDPCIGGVTREQGTS